MFKRKLTSSSRARARSKLQDRNEARASEVVIVVQSVKCVFVALLRRSTALKM